MVTKVEGSTPLTDFCAHRKGTLYNFPLLSCRPVVEIQCVSNTGNSEAGVKLYYSRRKVFP